jgi:F0F1-type ATP synthase membrane subunit c/vacuolar-type H+-ATPase subunit K
MMWKLRGWLLIGLAVAMLAPAARAEEEGAEKTADEPAQKITVEYSVLIIGTCLAAALCAVGGGLAISRLGRACIEAISRQPEAAGSMFAPMIVTAAMIEGGMLFAIVVCLVGMMR